MSLLRCTDCQGRKQLQGLGMVTKPCPTCKGAGHVIAEDSPPTATATAAPALEIGDMPTKPKPKGNPNWRKGHKQPAKKHPVIQAA